MKNKIYSLLVFTLILSASGCGESEQSQNQELTKAVNVRIAQATSNSDQAFLSVSGAVSAENSANLSTRVMGQVEQVMVNIGDQVSKGQLLVALNSADLKAKKAQAMAGITEAKAAFTIAEKDYNRYQRLFDQKSATQKELDDVTANYEMAKARLQAAQEVKNEIDAQFAYTNVLAPFKGVVTARFMDPGDLAKPGMPLIAIEAPDNFEVTARIPENAITSVREGMPVEVYIPSIESSFPGTVTQLSSSSSYSGGQYIAKVSLDQTDKNIRSGMFVTVNFPSIKNEATNGSQTIIIPESVVVNRGGLTGIYTVSQQETAVLRWIRLGKSFGENVEVISGLSTEEPYIVWSDAKLYNGAKLNIQ